MNGAAWWNDPLFGVTATVVAYVAALKLHARWRRLHPLFVCSAALVVLLMASGIPYESYRRGADLLVFCLGPATVALGVPMYKHALRLRRRLRAIVAGVVAGSLCGMTSSAFFVWAAGGSKELWLTALPKSVSSPISIEIARQLGGIPELGAVLTVLTGLLGSMVGPAFLRAVGVRDDVALGAAIGTGSHGIGTARIIRESELQGSAGGLAMGLAGIVTSVLAVPLYWLLQ
ncbi:LrgB family protein [Paenibacillus flagellatus]|uniref:LrgB family protein n=1 Tax=Paenibacillus flagellatus TaxID=2211139 RepID=A0A2V5K8P3_9BACL|nr:LrgB family protein [Paenibacillus flagellatus]PYI55895.1 LrgB family protein [Paenibacillus flagellatus]